MMLVVSPIIRGQNTSFLKAFEFGIDYGKLLTLPLDFENKAEVQLGLLTSANIRLSGEAGIGQLFPEEAFKNADYEVKGVYLRGGLDYFIPLGIKNTIYFGGRYAKSFFGDEGQFEIGSELWENFKQGIDRDDLTADWYEIVFGSENEWKPNLFLGWRFQLRILWEFENFEPVRVYNIPGYGRTFDESIPALSLYIKYRFKL